MEITKIMQVAAKHVKPSTIKLLEKESINNLSVFKKDEYGFFVVAETNEVDFNEVPSELAYLLGAAIAQDCYYLEIDYDYPVSPDLQVFEEEEDCGCL